MILYSKLLVKLVRKWPGQKYFGHYSFLPAFFFAGAVLEFTMINWTAGETNFYRTFKKNLAKKIVDDELNKQKNPIETKASHIQ